MRLRSPAAAASVPNAPDLPDERCAWSSWFSSQALELEHRAAELDEVVVHQLVAIDAPVVDVGAVGRARIAQDPDPVLGLDLSMARRHELVVQHHGALG